jgi:putative oxidoreductase
MPTHANPPVMQTPASSLPARMLGLFHGLNAALDALQPLAALLARGYVAEAFFKSGLTKLRDWDTTLALFHDEYKVPLLPPEMAAVMGTGGELVLPVLLLFGLGGRFGALGLSVVNVVAVVSLADIAPAALQQHMTWGVLLAGVAVFGSGSWSLDSWLMRRWPMLCR